MTGTAHSQVDCPLDSLPTPQDGSGHFRDTAGQPTSPVPTDAGNPDNFRDPLNHEVMTDSHFEALTDLVEQVDPAMAAEIEAAKSSDTIAFVSGLEPREYRLGYYSHETGTVKVKAANRGLAEQAGTLMHEWRHVRQMNGYGPCHPVNALEANSACSHTHIYIRHLQDLCSLLAAIEQQGEEYTEDCQDNWDPLTTPYIDCFPYHLQGLLSHSHIKDRLEKLQHEASLCPVSQGGPTLPAEYSLDQLPCTGSIILFGPVPQP
jgi:hypothetical protein